MLLTDAGGPWRGGPKWRGSTPRLTDHRIVRGELPDARAWSGIVTRSIQHQQLRAFGRVARKTKISDVRDPVALPLQHDEISHLPARIRRVAHEHRWAPLHQSRNEMPILKPGIVVEVRSDLRPTLLLQLRNEVEPHFIGEHVAYSIEVARVEALDISGEQRALGFCQNRERNV